MATLGHDELLLLFDRWAAHCGLPFHERLGWLEYVMEHPAQSLEALREFNEDLDHDSHPLS